MANNKSVPASNVTGLAQVAISGAYNDLSGKPTIPPASPLVKLASASGISGATLASTILTYMAGVSLATHVPMFAVIKFASGTLGIAVVILNANGVPITAGLPLSGLTSGNWAVMPVVPGVIANTGDLTAQLTTASLGSSTFDIEVFGVAY